MTAPACDSRAQCQINGLAGTAMALSVLLLVWAGAEALASDMAMGAALWLVALLAPTWVSAVYAGVARWRHRMLDWRGLAIVAGGMVWGIFVVNGGLVL
ncbi:MAG: hypothetical protein OQK05_06595 [Pseudopelagicola sp.]|nr:hypothetical protein [Pseudopelagicola sp.]